MDRSVGKVVFENGIDHLVLLYQVLPLELGGDHFDSKMVARACHIDDIHLAAGESLQHLFSDDFW